MTLEHKARHRWVQEISEINKKINKTAPAPAPARGYQPPPLNVPPGTRVLSPGLNLSNE